MASVQDTNIAETILTAIMLYDEFDIAEIEVLWLSHIEIWVRSLRVNFPKYLRRWIAKVLFMSFYAYTAV